jgi:hypothetical protein
MITMSFARAVLVFKLLTIPCVIDAQIPESGHPKVPTVESTAELVGVLPELTELRKLSASTAPADRWQILWLHQRISEEVTATSLQVDATIAQIDNEISRANELHSYPSHAQGTASANLDPG